MMMKENEGNEKIDVEQRLEPRLEQRRLARGVRSNTSGREEGRTDGPMDVLRSGQVAGTRRPWRHGRGA